jgi:hypothetical protein
MRKSILLSFLALITISCSQTKQIAQTPTREQVHRYATVYEGNRIIKYEKEESTRNADHIRNEEYTASVKGSEAVMQKKAQKLRIQPAHFSTLVKIKSKQQTKNNLTITTKAVENHTVEKSNTGHEGLIAFVLFILSTVLVFVVPQTALLLPAILGLLALIMAIIGVIKKNDRTDLILAEIVLWINVISALLVVIIVLIQL